MSFILDALRKSDARRRSQQGPTLAQPMTMGQQRAQRRWPKPALAVLLLLSAIMLVAYVWPEAMLRVLPRETPPPRPTLSNLSIPELPGEPAAVARVVSTEPAASVVESEIPTLDTAEVELAAEPEPEPEQAIASIPEALDDVSPDPEPRAAAPVLPEPTDTVAESAVEEPADYLLIWELPLAVRQGLPSLTMNLHVFTNDAQGRFVLINGQRRREGDQLSGGIQLVEIRPEGAILESRGYRFLLGR